MVTQKDIAEKLGVSASLVSRAISGTAQDIGASEKTIKKICATAKSLGYSPNVAALTLRGAKSKTIGVVIKDFDDPFLGRMTGELQELARKDGYSLVLTGFNAAEKNPCDTGSLLRYRLDALIICGSDICGSWVKSFVAKDIPVAQIGSDKNYKGVSRVEVDEVNCVEQLIEFILGSGHQRIGFIGTTNPPHQRRRKLFEEILAKTGMMVDLTMVVTVPDHKNAGQEAMSQLLEQAGENFPTAVIAADDLLAQAGLRAAYDRGYKVPQDISLTGIDDIPAASLMIPSLTTVRVPVKAMVRVAFSMIFSEDNISSNVNKVKAELVVRESCV